MITINLSDKDAETLKHMLIRYSPNRSVEQAAIAYELVQQVNNQIWNQEEVE